MKKADILRRPFLPSAGGTKPALQLLKPALQEEMDGFLLVIYFMLLIYVVWATQQITAPLVRLVAAPYIV